MRSLFARLVVAGLIGFALAGCGSTNGTSLNSGGLPNGSGGGSVPSTNGVGPAPTCALPPITIDNGVVSATAQYVGGNTFATDVASATGGPPNPYASPSALVTANCAAPVTTPPPPASHAVTFSGNNSPFEILRYTGVVPSLVYQFGLAGNESFYSYQNLLINVTYAPAATAPGTLDAIFLELVGNGTKPGVGSSLAGTYDVRVPCTSPLPTLSATTFAQLLCPIPKPSSPVTSGSNSYGSTSLNTTGPVAIAPGATGAFTPYSPAVYVVLNYSSATNPASTGNVLGIGGIVATL